VKKLDPADQAESFKLHRSANDKSLYTVNPYKEIYTVSLIHQFGGICNMYLKSLSTPVIVVHIWNNVKQCFSNGTKLC